MGGLLLEGVQNVDHVGKTNRVNSSIGVTGAGFDYFEDSGPAKSLERLGRRVFVPPLGKLEGIANGSLGTEGEPA